MGYSSIRSCLLPVVLGAVAYGATQAVLYRWSVGWFLSSGRGVAAVLVVLAVAAMGYVLARRHTVAPAIVSSLALAAGAWTAMTVTFAVLGFTNIFPILLAMGALIMTAGAILGGLTGCLVRRMWLHGADRGRGVREA